MSGTGGGVMTAADANRAWLDKQVRDRKDALTAALKTVEILRAAVDQAIRARKDAP